MMIHLALSLILLFAAAAVTADQVVFVHGLAGFGPDELFGLNYWGFTGIFGSGQDYFKPLRQKGFTVHYASVGPVSSNWDRACELYAQIKGTKVDYGKAHSDKYNHARYGNDYSGKGFYSSWSGNSNNKIHLVGHSMGGNTIRMIERLIQKGDSAERSASGSSVSNLFKSGSQKSGGSNWIQSVTTISTPFDGSTLTVKLGTGILEFVKDLLAAVAGVASIGGGDEWLFDFDLGHFGLDRNSGESFSSYKNRVFSSSIFNQGFEDLASYDLTPEWSKEFNQGGALTYSGTFYFSISTVQTHRCWKWGWDSCPDWDMEVLMSATALIIGNMDGVKDGNGYKYNNDWEQSDGVVPEISSRSPRVGVPSYKSPKSWNSDDSSWSKGQWYTMTINRDHLQIIGFRLNVLELNAADGIYDAIADTLDKCKIGSSAALNAPSEGEASLTEGQSEAPIGAIVGGVVGGLALVALVALVVVRRRSTSEERRTQVLVKSGAWASPVLAKSAKKPTEQVTSDVEAKESVISTENPVFTSEARAGGV